MRRSPEIIILLVLLLLGIGGVLGYVIYRRAKLHALPPVAAKSAGPVAPVDLARHDGQTIDFSSGRPVVKDSPADRAALAAAAKELAEATQDVTFKAPRKEPAPAKP